jgi:hypothetical protein
MSAHEILQFATLMAAVFLGLKILERLPKSNNDSTYKYERPDVYATLRIDAVSEGEFEISFVDGWNVGRSILVEGTLLLPDDKERLAAVQAAFGFRNSIDVRIFPVADWFQKSTFGHVRSFSALSTEACVRLPYQLAYQVLNELRRNPDQLIGIGAKSAKDKRGNQSWTICDFQMGKPL